MSERGAVQGFALRRCFVLLLMSGAMGALVWRAVDLQLHHAEFLRTQGDARHLRVIAVPAHRGMILDRHGEPMAASTPVDSVWVNPLELATERERWPELAGALDMDAEHLANLVARRADREFVYLKRHVEPEMATRVTGLAMAGVYTQREYRRYYPSGEATGHVLGFTNVDDVGQEGVELAFDDWLQGVDGSRRVIRDRLGRIVEDVESISLPRPGRDLELSIDRGIQHAAYRALLNGVQKHRAKSGTAVVMDVRTAEVLAMVNQPSFNPNSRGDRASADTRNRAITDVFEPGSTVKALTVAAALETGLFQPETRIETSPGFIRVGRYTIRDHHNYGNIDVSTIVTKSSNVGASKIALAIPPENLWRVFHAIGFGQPTGIGFPGEAAGILGTYTNWREAHRVTLSFGYGLSVSALQLVHAYATIANDGVMVPVSLQKLSEPGPPTRVMRSDIARQVTAMMEGVMLQGGTGQRGAVPGYRVAGKTGTVRKSEAGGYADKRYLSLFAGYAPVSAPRVAIVVVIDEPDAGEYYGGAVAAPVFADIMTATLRLIGATPDDRDGLLARVDITPSAAEDAAEAVQ